MGGFIPGNFISSSLIPCANDIYIDMVLYLTYFYKSNELPIRLSFFWTALSTCNIVGSLLAAGFLQMRGIGGWSGWRWLCVLSPSC
jgi:hypothetical protein